MKTKLFNIRITEEKHKKFKKYAEKKKVSMGYLLNSYIDSLLDESVEPIGLEPERITSQWHELFPTKTL